MDTLFILHLFFLIFFISIPFWPLKYLKYGVFAPITLATIWIIFLGCPLTRLRPYLNDEYFAQILLKPFFPNITKEDTTRVTHYILLLVTMISMVRLCPKVIRF